MNIGQKKDWTVLLYQGGVNNLDSSLAKNLTEWSQCDHPENVDILVRQIDRQGLQTDYQIDQRGRHSLHQSTTTVDSSSPETLSEFIKNGIQAYPAKHYLLAISSHGKGAEGVIEDEQQHKMMTLPELKSALQEAGQPMDAVYFDACRMMTAEVASELKGVAKVLIGSMDRIDSAGYDPSQMLHSVADSQDAKDLGTRLVNNFDKRQMKTFRTLSAVDLDNLEPLETAFQKLSTELSQLDPDSAQRIRRLLNESRRSTPSPTYLEGLDAMADSIYSGNTTELSDWLEEVRPSAPISVLALCYDLINETECAASHPELTKAAKAVIQAHDQAVFAQRNPDCDGLSVMLPLELNENSVPPTNSAFEQRTNWHSAVENLVPVGTPAELSKTWLEIELEGKK